MTQRSPSSIPFYPWQENVWHAMTEVERRQKLAHAYLFVAPRFTGLSTFMCSFAAYLLCLRKEKGRACGHCKGCKLYQAGLHPDAYVIQPENHVIKVGTVRPLASFLSLMPTYGETRIVLIEQADAMNTAAANSLLKALEEPPIGVVFLLSTHYPRRLPATILSRCQRQMLFPDEARSRVWLENEHVPVAEQAAFLDRPLALHCERYVKEEDASRVAESAWQDGTHPVQLAEQWKKIGLEWVLLGLIHSCAQCAYQQFGAYSGQNVLPQCDKKRLFMFWEEIFEYYAQHLNCVPMNEQLVLERLAVDWIALFN